MRTSTLTPAPAGIIRIRAFIDLMVKQPNKNAPWLAELQAALVTDPDLDQALYDEADGLAKSALAGIAYRLYRDEVPDSVRSSMASLGVVLRRS